MKRGDFVKHSDGRLGKVRLVHPGGKTVLVKYTNGTTVDSCAGDLSVLGELSPTDGGALILAGLLDYWPARIEHVGNGVYVTTPEY